MASARTILARTCDEARDVLLSALSPARVLGPFSRRSARSDVGLADQISELQETEQMATKKKAGAEDTVTKPAKKATEKSAAKKTAAKKTAAPAAKKSAAKKTAAKKTAAKKSAAAKTAATPAAKKSAAKKTAAKKTAAPAAKKSAAKETSAKKAAAPAAKKSAAAKTAAAPAAKKSAAKETSAKKAAGSGTNASSAVTSPLGAKSIPPSKSPKPKDGLRFGSPDYPFDQAFLDAQVERLLTERETLVGQANTLRSEADALARDREPGDVQFDDESGEGDTLAVERDMDLARAASAMQTVDEIDAALERIEKGIYGICETSGLPIPAERLEAIPYARERVEYKTRSFR